VGKKVKILEKIFSMDVYRAVFAYPDEGQAVGPNSMRIYRPEAAIGGFSLSPDEAIEFAGEIGKRFRRAPGAHYYGQITKVTESPKEHDGEGMVVEKLIVELDGGRFKFFFPADIFPAHRWPKDGGWILIHFNRCGKNQRHMVHLFKHPGDPDPYTCSIGDEDLIDIDA
jgi:hypothetical protein